MTKLLFSDLHITDKSIQELDNILLEIMQFKADKVIMLGDLFDKVKPTASEIYFATKLSKKLVDKYKDVVYIVGNHETTGDISILDYLTFFGIKVVPEYIDDENIYYGHFMTNKSRFEYGSYTKTISELKKEGYKYVFLGHQHSFQKLASNMYHIGSVRYVGFNERFDENKFIVLINNKVNFIKLISPIKMVEVSSLEELEKLDSNLQVYYKVNNFDQFKKEINTITKEKTRFYKFKLKINFDNTSIKTSIKENTKQNKLEKIIEEWLKKLPEEVRELISKELW